MLEKVKLRVKWIKKEDLVSREENSGKKRGN